MQPSTSATVRTFDESIVSQLRDYAIDVEGGPAEKIDSIAAFHGTGDEDDHKSEATRYTIRGVRLMYASEDDAPEDRLSYGRFRYILGNDDIGQVAVEFASNDPFYTNKLGQIPGDDMRKFLDADVERLVALCDGDWESLGYDSREDAIVNLAREWAREKSARHDDRVEDLLDGFDLSDEDARLANNVVAEYRLDEAPFEYLGLSIHEGDGGYYYEQNTEDRNEKVYVTNWTLDVLAYLEVNGEQQVRMRVKPNSPRDPSYVVTVPLTVFNDRRVFLDHVVIGKTTRFDGNAGHLNDLREYVGSIDAPDKVGVSKITIIDGHLITPNGVLTADGWVDDSEYVFVSTGNDLEDRWYLSPDAHDSYDDEEVARILSLLPQMRAPERIIPTLGWFYTVGFRQHIWAIEDGFNGHNVFGQSEAGKSATMKTLGNLWGMDYLGKGLLEADISNFALESAFSLTDTAPLLFDEFKPADMSPHKVDRFKRFFRNSTGGASRPKGTKSQETREYDFKTPVAFAGEQAVTGVAETRRAIPTVFEIEASRPGTSTEMAWGELTGNSFTDPETGEKRLGQGSDYGQHALAYYLFVLRQDAEDIKNLWMEVKNTVENWTTSIDIENLKQMHVQGFATILFGVRMMNRLAREVDHDEPPVTDEMARDTIEYVAGLVGDRGAMNDLDTFLYYCGLAARDGALEINEEYKLVHPGTDREELRLNLTYAHDKVMTWVNKTGKDGTNLLTNPSDYRTRIEEAFEGDDPAVKTVFDSQGRFGMPTSDINRAIGFDMSVLEERIEGFSRHMFVERETATEYADGSVSIDHVSKAIPVSKLDTGKHTLTVTVASQAADPPAHFAQQGLLSDESGTVKYHVWAADQSEVETVTLKPGRTYCLHNALVSDHEGDIEVQLAPGITEVNEIEPGKGYSEAESSTPEVSA